jgi:predicted alternative tryptophan synthase beta-subunit
MPKLDKIFTLEVTPEQFLRACSKEELLETDILLMSNHYQLKMNGTAPRGDNKINNALKQNNHD